MNHKSLRSPTTRNKQHEEKDGEETNDEHCASAETLIASEKCPICLNNLTLEIGFPEPCRHAFCISCILKWSETSTSCPVDRKPFQAIHKIDLVGSWTKIIIKERRPRENLNCICEQMLTCCTKGKLCFRIDVKEETSEIATPHKENKYLDFKERPEMEIVSLSWPNCVTGGIIATCPFNLFETTPCFNRTEQEESEVCLIRRKREALNHLRIPLGAEAVEGNSTLPAEILIHPPSSLDEYISELSPISVRSKDYSNKTCALTGVQEGTEKKQAASGTSTSRGSRRKSVQSSTRRRSTRNSKSDTSNLHSSPKSSSSDHDTPGYNSATRNTSSSEHPGKQPPKRKQAPKKGSQTRKRLRSATPPQEDDKKHAESEPEQEKKCKISDNLSETELSEINQVSNNSHEKEPHPANTSSPIEHSEEKHLLDSSSAHNVKSVDNERSASPDLNNKHQFDLEHSSPSPVFKNGQTDLEDSQADLPRSVNEPSGMDSAENLLETEEKHSLESGNLNVSDGESAPSPGSTKQLICDHTVMPLLSCDKVEQFEIDEPASSPTSCTEIKSPRKDLQDVPSSEPTEVNVESTLHTGQLYLQLNESNLENMGSSSTQSTLPLQLVKPSDLDSTPISLDASKEQSIQKPQNIQQLMPNDYLNTLHSQDERENILEVSLQAEKPEECIGEKSTKTSMSSKSDYEPNSDSSVIVDLSEQSLALSNDPASEEISDTGEIQGNRLCNEEVKSPNLGEGKTHDPDRKTDLQNDHQKVFCEDNIEPVAMDCDSVCSDHNDSEVEQSVDINEPTKTESDTMAANEVLQSPPKPSLPPGDAHKKESRTRKSRFHSPSTTWSPSKNDIKERPRSRSRSKVRDSPVKRKSRSHSRDRDGNRSHSDQWKGRSRDRHDRKHSRSKSRSRSGSHTGYRNRSVTIDRNEKNCSSPPWKERHLNENWRSPRGSEKYRRNEHDKHEHFRNDKYNARDSAEAYPDNKNDYPDWVIERMKSGDRRGRGDTWMRGESRGRGDWGWFDGRGRGDRARGRGDFRGRGDRGRGGNRGRGFHWEDDPYESGDSWNRNVNMDWNSPRSRGERGRGGFRGGFNYGDQNENNWNNRLPYSGNCNTLGQEASRFPESKIKPKYEDPFGSPAGRSGWSSASSWAVRKTLPADVQSYYSKRGRTSTGSQGAVWPKQEESQDQDQATKDQASQQNESTPVPVNMVQTQMNVVQQPIAAPPQPINMFPYSVGVHPPLVNIQHNPYNLHPPLPIHLHPALPLVQVSAPSSVPQGLPPPPPPPPPSQHVSYIAPQQDGKPLQAHPGATYVSNNVNAPLLPAPAAVQGTVGVVLGPNSVSVATTGHSKNSYTFVKSAARKESVTVEASADGSKKKIQERAAHEVKVAIKQYYQNKDITKDEYKEIVKKAVDKVCHSKSGEVDSAKVANLVKAYVDKYKHSRKKGPDDKL